MDRDKRRDGMQFSGGTLTQPAKDPGVKSSSTEKKKMERERKRKQAAREKGRPEEIKSARVTQIIPGGFEDMVLGTPGGASAHHVPQ